MAEQLLTGKGECFAFVALNRAGGRSDSKESFECGRREDVFRGSREAFLAAGLSGDNSSMTQKPAPLLRLGASVSLVALIILGLAWEFFIAPLRPGGSLLALKVLPLLLPLRGVLRGNLYTMQWAAMLILLYFMEGVVRAWSDPSPASNLMAVIEIVLSLTFYLCAILYLRPAKKQARLEARQRAAAQAGAEQSGTSASGGQAG